MEQTSEHIDGPSSWFNLITTHALCPVLLSLHGKVAGVNPALMQYLGRAAEDLAGLPLAELLEPGDLIGLDWIWDSALDLRPQAARRAARLKVGALTGTWVSLEMWQFIGADGVYTLIRFDPEQDKALDERLKRVERAKNLLIAINRALLEEHDEQLLLSRVCDLCVSAAGYRLAWIGYPLDDEEQSVEIRAVEGFEIAFLPSLYMTWANAGDSYSLGPTGIAIRSGKICVMHDLLHNPQYEPWRDAAVQCGYLAAASLPLVIDGKVIGTLDICAAEDSSFDQEELGLLEELASKIAFGIITLRRNAERLEAMQNLHAAKEFLSGLLDTAPMPIYATDRRGRFITVNKAWRALFNCTCPAPDQYEPEELIGAANHRQFEMLQREVLGFGRSVTHEGKILTTTGSRDYQTFRFPLHDADGAITAVGGISQDVTDVKLKERELRHTLWLLAEAQQTASLGSWDLDTATGQATWSENMYRVFDIQPGDPNVRSVEYFKEHLILPEDRERVLDALGLAIANQKPYDVIYRFKREDGEIRTIHAKGQLRAIAPGQPPHLIGTVQDITQQKQVEEQLSSLNEELVAINEELRGTNLELAEAYAAAKESEQRYRTVFDQSPAGIYRTTPEGKILLANAALVSMLGYTSFEELEQRQLASDGYLDPTFRQHFLELAQRPGGVAGLEATWVKADGTPLIVRENARPAYDERGEVLYFDGTVVDITERRRVEQQLRQMQKLEAIGTLAGGIAHDFNNILFGILGYADLLREELPPESLASQNLEEIIQAGRRAKDLVQQILTFTRRTEQKRVPVSLTRIAKEVLKLMRATLPATIEIKQNLAVNGDIILADPTELHQVAMNLCTNAGHAMPGGGQLEVAVRILNVDEELAALHQGLTPGPHVLLSVVDTGTGISHDQLERIFEPFYTTKEPGTGTGLGLSVVYGIVQGLGGAIAVYSEVGKGTAFHIYLPQSAEAREAETGGRSAELPTGSERVLVVDDEPGLMRLTSQLLTRLGYEVAGFSNSLEALAAFEAAPDGFDLVFTDQTMPGLTGINLARALLALRPALPVIIATGFAHRGLEEEAAALGVREVVSKPLVSASLSACVRKALDGAAPE